MRNSVEGSVAFPTATEKRGSAFCVAKREETGGLRKPGPGSSMVCERDPPWQRVRVGMLGVEKGANSSPALDPPIFRCGTRQRGTSPSLSRELLHKSSYGIPHVLGDLESLAPLADGAPLRP